MEKHEITAPERGVTKSLINNAWVQGMLGSMNREPVRTEPYMTVGEAKARKKLIEKRRMRNKRRLKAIKINRKRMK
jgi:hypothetical protein